MFPHALNVKKDTFLALMTSNAILGKIQTKDVSKVVRMNLVYIRFVFRNMDTIQVQKEFALLTQALFQRNQFLIRVHQTHKKKEKKKMMMNHSLKQQPVL